MKKSLAVLLALSMIAIIGYGCDGGGTVTTENLGWLSQTSDAILYYPTNISSPTAATTMSAGYTQDVGDVEWLAERVAEAGFVVLGFTPTSEWGYVADWRDAHKSCIEELRSINASHSVLRGLIDESKLQTCGHSKGGGGSLWASSQLQGDLKTTIGMAPYEEGFYDSTLGSVTAATLIQAGSGDTLATNSMTRGEYGGLPSNISKAYFEYSGYDHLEWTTGSTSSSQDRIAGDILAWMKYYLKGDTSQASTLSNTSGTSRHEWIDNSGNSSSSSSSSSSGGCN